jgi:SpoVK/Ycf46/Vps4 family AAA+-type ATPase
MSVSSSYKNGREHLDDELLKLDALLQLQMFDRRESPTGSGADMFRGLYISDEEIDKISREKTGSLPNEDPAAAGKRKVLQTGIERQRDLLSKKIQRSLEQGIHLPLHHLASIFRLDTFEWDTLIICLAPQLNLKYEKLYAYLQDDVTKKQPSVNLILELLCGGSREQIDALSFFFLQSPLLRYRLVSFTRDRDETSMPLLSRCLSIDESIAQYLLGFNTFDFRLSSFARVTYPRREWASLVLDDKLKNQLIKLSNGYFDGDTGSDHKQRLVFYLRGPRGAGKKTAAEAFCHYLGLLLVVVDTRDLVFISGETDLEKNIGLLFRESLLHSAAVYFDGFDRLFDDHNDPGDDIRQKTIIRAVREFSFLTFFAGEKEWESSIGEEFDGQLFIKLDVPVPSYEQRKRLWTENLASRTYLDPSVDIDAAADKFGFTPGQIGDAVREAENSALLREIAEDRKEHGNAKSKIKMEDLYRGCHSQSNQKLSRMARKIEPRYTWDDIVLPIDKFRQLKEICSHVKHRQLVYSAWGFGSKFSLGKGLNILFSGSSGTGKTMGAEIIAQNLGLELYKIDLSGVVSKYIGETEKNLNRVFKEAETANCILFFDEADALFGKRSEVKDSHDRYANIEINYLLQKMEEHEGVVILATNFIKNIDEAFKRRIHFSVDFPFPDEMFRFKIWQKIFPLQTPMSDDIDFEFLAKKFNLSGGNIKNIAVNAAFLAAEDSQRVEMSHTLLATRRELQKMGKHCSPSDFGKYNGLFEGGDESE